MVFATNYTNNTNEAASILHFALSLFHLVSPLFHPCFSPPETPQLLAGTRFIAAKTPLFHLFPEKSISASKNAKC